MHVPITMPGPYTTFRPNRHYETDIDLSFSFKSQVELRQ